MTNCGIWGFADLGTAARLRCRFNVPPHQFRGDSLKLLSWGVS